MINLIAVNFSSNLNGLGLKFLIILISICLGRSLVVPVIKDEKWLGKLISLHHPCLPVSTQFSNYIMFDRALAGHGPYRAEEQTEELRAQIIWFAVKSQEDNEKCKTTTTK